jgi:hypothetical protein
MTNEGIALAGSASMALTGTLFRPSENPLHDIDFNSMGKSKEEIAAIIKKYFKYFHFKTEIVNSENQQTVTYFVMDRAYTTKLNKGKWWKSLFGKKVAKYDIFDKETGEYLGYYEGSEVKLNEGVHGKFLDFFVGEGNNRYPAIPKTLNGKLYLVADARNALNAKIEWQRVKDIWDYVRYLTDKEYTNLQDAKERANKYIAKKLKNAKVIWAHPAIGKTEYLKRATNILDWDAEVGEKRDRFVREQVRESPKAWALSTDSDEFKELVREYMANWTEHPEYIEFLKENWEKLKDRAKRENKVVFTSVLALMELYPDDFDLYLNSPEKTFREHNRQRGGKFYQTLRWKQTINRYLSQVDADKILTSDKYLREIYRDILGVTWETLTDAEYQALVDNGMSKEEFDSLPKIGKEEALNCVGF